MTQLNNLDSEVLERYRKSFSDFEKTELCGQGAWLCPERRAAFESFEKKGFPGLKDEAWRYTPLENAKKILPQVSVSAAADQSLIAPYVLEPSWPRAVFINGLFQAGLSQGLDWNAGIKIMSLAEAVRSREPGVESNLRPWDKKPRSLTDLNTALFLDGIYLELGTDQSLKTPLQVLSLFSFSEREGTVNTRNIILARPGSHVAVIQTFAGTASYEYFANEVTEIQLSEKASLNHYVLQQGSRKGLLTARCEIRLGTSSSYKGSVLSADARFFRYETDAALNGPGAAVTLSGLYLTTGEELMDQNVLIEHRVPDCTSEQILKGIVDGRSRLVMRGKVHVFPDAQKTAASQTMRNLLLSPSAIVDAKPELEIFADDVKCSHGTAIGQLEDDSIFYLQSRGIGAEEARRILTRGFAMEIIEKIALDPLKRAAESALNTHFSAS